MKNLGLSDMKVEERLFVNGNHLRGNKDFLPNGEAAPPAASVGSGLLLEATQDPTPDARTYVSVEMPGWQGQLVVTLFARAVHAGGALSILNGNITCCLRSRTGSSVSTCTLA
jgi:hypothetical protein